MTHDENFYGRAVLDDLLEKTDHLHTTLLIQLIHITQLKVGYLRAHVCQSGENLLFKLSTLEYEVAQNKFVKALIWYIIAGESIKKLIGNP